MTEKELARLLSMTEYERPYWDAGKRIGGADEAGRGPLAGPVVAACVVLPDQPLIEWVNDSKKMTPRRRDLVFDRIGELGSCAVGVVEPEVIDQINILQATKQAFCQAFDGLAHPPEVLLVDAVQNLAINAEQIPLIKGDTKSYLIAAASVIAKVTRDRMMEEYDVKYPEYGFARHKGYGTAEHIRAIQKYGPCPIHRRTYIRKWL